MATASYEIADLYPAQRAAIFDEARISCIEASTKAGKTSGCIVWLCDQALRKGAPGRAFWWIAPTYKTARIAYRRTKRILPRGYYRQNDSELTLTLANGARLEFRSGEKPDNLYGEDVWAAVIDEASRMREEAWHAIRSTLTFTGGPVRMIGNVRGRKNWFWELSRKAEAGEAGLAYHRLTWRDAVNAGVIEAQEIEDARRDLPESVFRELYEAEASDDGSNPFGQEEIEACVIEVLGVGAPVRFGIDLARARDYTVVIGLDGNVHVCVFDRWNQTPWSETLDRIDATVGNVRALVDSTGIGDPLLEALQRPISKTEGHFVQDGLAPRSARVNYEGYQFTGPSKQALMERLAVAIQRQEIRFPDGPIATELSTFEYEYTRTGVRYSAPEGLHDDCVCALALAVWHMPTRISTAAIPGGTTGPSKWQGPGGTSSRSKWR